jgi:hypothetical protein
MPHSIAPAFWFSLVSHKTQKDDERVLRQALYPLPNVALTSNIMFLDIIHRPVFI